MRPSWDETFVHLADEWARRATCPRLHVGAVIVDSDRHVISSGYNGSPHGLPHCTDVGCAIIDNHCSRSVHAEVNAIIEVARKILRGSIMYTPYVPCIKCTPIIIQSGIQRLVCTSHYKNEDPDVRAQKIEMLRQGSVELTFVDL